jgi:extradiol dioxygenase family protein
MSAETSQGQIASGLPGVAAHVPERRARGAAERRTQNHPLEVKVFGGSRATDKETAGVTRVGVGPRVIWFAIIVLVMLAYPVSKGLLIKPSEGVGYYFGYTGGVMMLLMLLYPLRKHWKYARNWGALRYWFMLHMVFGIGGPTLVLFHSSFHLKSLNATVAFYSMLLVALSGIVGRFIYKRIHLGLYGRKSTLEELQRVVELSRNQVNRVGAVLIEASGVGDKLKQFRELAEQKEVSFSTQVWRFVTFDWRKFRLYRNSQHELKLAADLLGSSEGWDRQLHDQHYHDVVRYVSRYLTIVQQAAQFSAYERLFRLWHILHTPFVWLLGISGIVHVIAVNMY